MRDPQAFKIKHIISVLEKTRNEMADNFKNDILKTFAQGGLTPVASGPQAQEMQLPFEPLDGKLEEALTAVKNFGKREFTIPFTKVTGELLLSVAEWSPAELTALEPIVVELVVV